MTVHTSRGRECAAATLLCGLGSALVLIAAGQTWVSVGIDLPSPLPDTHHGLDGRELAPLAGALGLAGLAGAAGIIATRGYARLVVGVLLLLCGAGAVAATVVGVTGTGVHQALAAEAVLVRGGDASPVRTAWWMVSLGGAALLTSGGLLTAIRGAQWPGLSRKYEAPAAQASPDPHQRGHDGVGTEHAGIDMWDSLDQGRDPTVS